MVKSSIFNLKKRFAVKSSAGIKNSFQILTAPLNQSSKQVSNAIIGNYL